MYYAFFTHVGEMKTQVGRLPVTFAGYKVLIQKALLDAKWSRRLPAAHLFMILQWNLMSRQESVSGLNLDNISWNGDCLHVFVPKHKADLKGDNSYNRNIYANPLVPSLCPILSLAIYLACTTYLPRRGTQSPDLFQGTMDHRFCSWLSNCLDSLNELERMELGGATIEDFGTHSFRKGSSIFVSTFPGGPNPVSVDLRGGWKLPGVRDRYIYATEGGDQLCGRLLAGLPFNSYSDFGALPPHFNTSFLGSSILPGDGDWRQVFEAYRMFPITFRSCVPFLFASLIFHADWIKSNLPKEHPFFKTRFWSSNLREDLKDHIHSGSGVNRITGMGDISTAFNIISNYAGYHFNF
jgi:hypothetical protein